MIKINLLPVRAAKKKESAVQQIVLFCFGIGVVLLVCLAVYVVERTKIATAKSDITAANVKITDLKSKIGKLEELKTLKEDVKKKLDVLTQLRKNKSGPAKRLSTLSSVVPDQLWLTSYAETGESIKISGLAVNEELIASFMRGLEASSDFLGVELVVSEQSETAGTKLKKFEITCRLRSSVAAVTPTAPVPPAAATASPVPPVPPAPVAPAAPAAPKK